ncbi:hypothetical protein [Paenibacillus agricola]|uniref:hypothetical protein n=1 Tax=Paenibacillus agricola TaxID=2716264 RepID=UPI001FB670DB
MPNTNPPASNVDNFHSQVAHLQSKAFVDFGLWGICLGRLNLKEIAALDKAAVIGFNFFLATPLIAKPSSWFTTIKLVRRILLI